MIYRVSGATLQRFHLSNERRRGVIGPVRSGKSVACLSEIIIRAHQQRPWSDGIRRTRWLVIRDTFADLKRTTIATWTDRFGGKYGNPVRRTAGYELIIDQPLKDGTRLYVEILFFSLDSPDDAEKLLSLETTGAYINEARKTHRSIINNLDDRVGQYPPKDLGGPTWSGWFFDSNPPDDTSWLYELAEIEKPEGWAFFRQPGGIIKDPNTGAWTPNPLAENVENLNDEDGQNYYMARLSGKTEDHINVMYGGNYGFLVEGRLVIPEYFDDTHKALGPIEYVKGMKIFVGVDGGLTPAAAFLQRMPNRRWHMVEELVGEKVGPDVFVTDAFKPKLEELVAKGFSMNPDAPNGIVITCDPSMWNDADGGDMRHYKAAGIRMNRAFSNDWGIRRAVLGKACGEMVEGRPRFVISPSCKKSRTSLGKGYVLKKVGTENHGASKYQLKPDKDEHSHIGDAIMYAMMGAGEGRVTQVEKKQWGAPRLGTVA